MPDYQVPFTVQGRADHPSIFVDAKFNGSTVNALVDTGDAVGPVVPQSLAQQLGLPDDGPLGVSGAGGAVQLRATHLDVELGGATFPAESGAIDPSLDIAIIGLPFFDKVGTLLDFEFSADKQSGVLKFGDQPPSSGADQEAKESAWDEFQDALRKWEL